jgi:ABC transporter transmembrane region
MIVIVIASPFIAALLPVLFAVLWVVQKVYLGSSRQLRVLEIEARGPLYDHFLQCLSGLSTIQAFGWGSALRKDNLEHLESSQQAMYSLYTIQIWLRLVLDLCIACICVIMSGIITVTRHSSSVGYVGLAFVNIVSVPKIVAFSHVKTLSTNTSPIHGVLDKVGDSYRCTYSDKVFCDECSGRRSRRPGIKYNPNLAFSRTHRIQGCFCKLWVRIFDFLPSIFHLSCFTTLFMLTGTLGRELAQLFLM